MICVHRPAIVSRRCEETDEADTVSASTTNGVSALLGVMAMLAGRPGPRGPGLRQGVQGRGAAGRSGPRTWRGPWLRHRTRPAHGASTPPRPRTRRMGAWRRGACGRVADPARAASLARGPGETGPDLAPASTPGSDGGTRNGEGQEGSICPQSNGRRNGRCMRGIGQAGTCTLRYVEGGKLHELHQPPSEGSTAGEVRGKVALRGMVDGRGITPDPAPSMASTPDPAGAWSLDTTTAPDLARGPGLDGAGELAAGTRTGEPRHRPRNLYYGQGWPLWLWWTASAWAACRPPPGTFSSSSSSVHAARHERL